MSVNASRIPPVQRILRFSLKLLPSISFFYFFPSPSEIFFIFLHVMFFDVFHHYSVYQATQTTPIAVKYSIPCHFLGSDTNFLTLLSLYSVTIPGFWSLLVSSLGRLSFLQVHFSMWCFLAVLMQRKHAISTYSRLIMILIFIFLILMPFYFHFF